MEQTEDNITEEIVQQVLTDNSFIFRTDARTLTINPEKANIKNVFHKAMLKYGKHFFEQLKTLCPDITSGFLIGLTKHYLEFSLRAITKIDKDADEKKIDNLYSSILQKTLQSTAKLVNDGTAVHVIYGKIKKTADESSSATSI